MVADLRAWSPRLGIPETFLSEEWIRHNIFRWFMLTKRDKSHRWACAIRSKDGWQFAFREGRLCAWGTPEIFFGSDTPPDLRRMAGKWRLSEKQAADLVRKTVRDLGFDGEVEKLLLEIPEVEKPNLRPPPTVPRYLFEWQKTKLRAQGNFRYISCRITAEVDADRQKLQSLSVYTWEEGDDQIIVQ